MRRRGKAARFAQNFLDGLNFALGTVGGLIMMVAFSFWRHGEITNFDLAYVCSICGIFVISMIMTVIADR